MALLNKTKEPIHDDVIAFVSQHDVGATRDGATAAAARPPIAVEVALQWNGSYTEAIFCYTNNVHNKDGGTHLTGLRAALTEDDQQLRRARRTSSRS